MFLPLFKKMHLHNLMFFMSKNSIHIRWIIESNWWIVGSLSYKLAVTFPPFLLRSFQTLDISFQHEEGRCHLHARGPSFWKFGKDWRGAARTQAPTSTNYDVHSPTWGDVRLARCPSAMRTANLGHGLSWSPIDPVQVSNFFCPSACCFIIHPFTPLSISFRCGAKISRSSTRKTKTVSRFSKEFICLEEAVCFELGWIHERILGTFERKLRSCILDLVSSFFGFW